MELAPDSYVAFVQHPDNPKDIEYGITHAGNPGAAVTVGTMQHVALHVDRLDDVLAMRDRIRSRHVQVFGPIDHGFVQSIYFAGPEGLSLEICCGADIDERAWIDPEVVGLCELTPDEIAALKDPAPFLRPAEPLPQPPTDLGPRVRVQRGVGRVSRWGRTDRGNRVCFLLAGKGCITASAKHTVNQRRDTGSPRYESSNSRSSRLRSRIRLLSAVRIASARWRFRCCSSTTRSSTVSRAISR